MRTNDAIYELIEEVSNQLNNGNKAIAIFLDLAKAFSIVFHELLLKILEEYGVKGRALEVFINYSKDRQQYAKVNETTDDFETAKIGGHEEPCCC